MYTRSGYKEEEELLQTETGKLGLPQRCGEALLNPRVFQKLLRGWSLVGIELSAGLEDGEHLSARCLTRRLQHNSKRD